MGKSRDAKAMRTTGSFPSSSSSSDFEFTVSLSPSSRRSTSTRQCPADELFYKGQILPLHLSPRISMVRTLLLASSSSSTSSSSTSTDTGTTASRDSNSSSSSSAAADLHLLLPDCCDSSRPSSVTEEEVIISSSAAKRGKYFSSLANRFSSVFLSRGGSKKDASPSADKRANTTTAKQVIRKCVSKVKPLYEKLSSMQKNQNQNPNPNPKKKKKTFFSSMRRERDMTAVVSSCDLMEENHGIGGRGAFPDHQSQSFSGNLRYPRRKRCEGSCPSSMRSSPTHSGLLCMKGGFQVDPPALLVPASSSSSSSMQELQNAIQGAIAHCKRVQSDPKKNFSDEPQDLTAASM